MSSRPRPGEKARNEEQYFLDANVLMYAAGTEHPLREPCREALRRAVDEKKSLVTDSEVLQEILYRYFAIRRPDAAQSVYRSAIGLCDSVLPVAEPHTSRALELLLKYRDLSARDAIHIATMEAAGLRLILSTDSDFDTISEVDRIDPARFST
jgi:uncharacterized protein